MMHAAVNSFEFFLEARMLADANVGARGEFQGRKGPRNLLRSEWLLLLVVKTHRAGYFSRL